LPFLTTFTTTPIFGDFLMFSPYLTVKATE